MTDDLLNPLRGAGLALADTPLPARDPAPVAALLRRCPAHVPTPLRASPALARAAGVAEIRVKDERTRMGLGSFKALGAAYVIAHDAVETGAEDPTAALSGRVYVTASAGNHGLSVAAGARLFGARAVIHLADTVPEPFAARLRAMGAEVVRSGADYAASMAAAADMARDRGDTLLSDSSWPGYTALPHRLMEGYLQMAAEAADACETPPTHVFLQAGVGGMAAAVAAHLRARWGDAVKLVVVEPEAAPALIEAIRAGRIVDTDGPDSAMGRLDCKTASMIALAGLSREADRFVTISEAEAQAAVDALAADGIPTTPSGAAGVAAVLAGRPSLPADARVLCFVTEGPEDG